MSSVSSLFGCASCCSACGDYNPSKEGQASVGPTSSRRRRTGGGEHPWQGPQNAWQATKSKSPFLNFLRRTSTSSGLTPSPVPSSPLSKKPLTTHWTLAKRLVFSRDPRQDLEGRRQEEHHRIANRRQRPRHPKAKHREGVRSTAVRFALPRHPPISWPARHRNHRRGHVLSTDHGTKNARPLKNRNRNLGCGGGHRP